MSACALSGNVVNFRGGVCSVRVCDTEDLKLTRHNGGWEVYHTNIIKQGTTSLEPVQQQTIATTHTEPAQMTTATSTIIKQSRTVPKVEMSTVSTSRTKERIYPEKHNADAKSKIIMHALYNLQ